MGHSFKGQHIQIPWSPVVRTMEWSNTLHPGCSPSWRYELQHHPWQMPSLWTNWFMHLLAWDFRLGIHYLFPEASFLRDFVRQSYLHHLSLRSRSVVRPPNCNSLILRAKRSQFQPGVTYSCVKVSAIALPQWKGITCENTSGVKG